MLWYGKIKTQSIMAEKQIGIYKQSWVGSFFEQNKYYRMDGQNKTINWIYAAKKEAKFWLKRRIKVFVSYINIKS